VSAAPLKKRVYSRSGSRSASRAAPP
jgi:hypothetical protein